MLYKYIFFVPEIFLNELIIFAKEEKCGVAGIWTQIVSAQGWCPTKLDYNPFEQTYNKIETISYLKKSLKEKWEDRDLNSGYRHPKAEY